VVSVFDFSSYKPYLEAAIRAFPKQGHGIRLKLAAFAECQSTYVSQVLKGDAHFNMEQAERVSRFLQLSPAETEYFLLLVQEERAATKELRAHYRRSCERLLEARKVLKNRFETPQHLSNEDRAKYFSAWYYAAIHLLLTIPSFRTRDAIHERLGLPLAVVDETLEFLTRVGFALQEGGEYRPGPTIMHLGNDSPLLNKHHLNWRLQTMLHIDHASRDDLHYSSVITISEKDFHKVRELFVKTLESARTVINVSPEERLYSLCLDFFEL
jgi:uncharacterized protein (TIGR02147 family)